MKTLPRTWKVIKAGDGRLAAVDLDNPTRPVLYRSFSRVDCLNWIDQETERRARRQSWADVLIYGGGIFALLWLILWLGV